MPRTRVLLALATPLTISLVMASPARTQESDVAPGDTVRVSRATLASDSLGAPAGGWKGEGVVVGVGPGELRLTNETGTHAVRIGPASRVEVRRGTRPWGPIKGALIGTALAVGAGLAWEGSDSLERRGCEVVDQSANGSPIYRCERDRRDFDQWWLVTGAAAGFALGRLIRVPRWLDATTDGARVGVGVGPARALSLEVRIPVGGVRD